MKGNTFDPNYDMFLWGWGGDPDPNFILSIFTSSQINAWSDCAWSDPQYDRLFLEQQTTIDQSQRAAIVHQMEQIIYEQSPYIPTAYPESVEAYNYADWTGWQSTPGRGGGVFYTSPVMATYLTVHPVDVASARRASSRRSLPLLLDRAHLRRDGRCRGAGPVVRPAGVAHSQPFRTAASVDVKLLPSAASRPRRRVSDAGDELPDITGEADVWSRTLIILRRSAMLASACGR